MPASFAGRLAAYRQRMGLTQTAMAELLQIRYHTYMSYEGSKRSEPSFADLARFANRMLVSADWLIGRNTLAMWDLHLQQPLRERLRSQMAALALSSLGTDARVCALIRWLHRYDALQYDVAILSGLARLTSAQIQSIVAGNTIELPTETGRHLADYCGFNGLWLETGEGVPFILDYTPFEPVLHMIGAYGLNVTFLLQQASLLQKLQSAWLASNEQA